MKPGHAIRRTALTAVLSLVLLALSATPALAASESIELDPEEGQIGVEVEVYGEDFDESYEDGDDYVYVYVKVYFSSEEADEGDEIDDEVENYETVDTSEQVDEDGDWETTFDVPDTLTDGEDDEDVEGGTYYVYVTYKGDDEIVAVAEFEIAVAEIELDTNEGPVGTEVEISGIDFTKSEAITVEFDNVDVDIESGDNETDSSGGFECTIIVPEAGAGGHTITVTDGEDTEVEATFTVEPEIEVTPSSINSPDDSITVSGTGFAENANLAITICNGEVATADTNSRGSFGLTFIAPEEISLHSNTVCAIEAEDEDDNFAEDSITILDLQLSAPSTPEPPASTTDEQPGEAADVPPATDTPATTSDDTDMPRAFTFLASLGMPEWAVYACGGVALLIVFLIGYMIGIGGKAN